MTSLPASGLAGPSPWISAMVFSTGGSTGAPSPSHASPHATGVGAAALKSALLLSVSAPLAPRLSELVTLVPLLLTAVSYVLEVP